MTEDEDKPLFEPFQTEELDYGPSWGCIIALGLSGIALLVFILIFA